MNRAELRDLLGFILNFNDGQTNQDFSTTRLNQALQRAYRREVAKCKQEGDIDFFLKSYEFTWTASTLNWAVPNAMRGDFLRIMDITEDSAVGTEVQFSEHGVGSDVFYKDKDTLQWGIDGPPDNRTLRVYYLAQVETMEADDDEPALVPEQFHELIAWSAAVELREIADGAAPQAFVNNRDELRLDYWKHASLGLPQDDPNTIRVRDSDEE